MSKANKDLYRPTDGLNFLSLGGSGEIGMNLSLYGCDGKWLMVDLGVTFADDNMPGIDVIMPDPTFITERRNDLVGLVLTHGHEDHLGAIEYLWPQLQCPVYATAFTAGLLRAKLSESEITDQVRIIEVPLSGSVKLGPFECQWISITHSIPEANCIAIKTKHGTVLHTGDWKLDPAPISGRTTDVAALQRLGEEGVAAMVCDSTNAQVPGHSGSEKEVHENLIQVFKRFSNRIIITCFSSNVARLISIYRAAKANDRDVVLVGRSLWRIATVARETGYIGDDIVFMEPHEAGFLPRDKAVYICTGSQGEYRSALSKLAADDHPELTLEAGDVVLFSSREIPGNEKAIGNLQNALVAHGIEIVTANEAPIHVSGHPYQEELAQMYQWVRPKLAVPVHGEIRHQTENARIAASCQVPQSIIPANGQIIRLAPGPAEKVGEVQSGRWVLDGTHVRPMHDGAMKDRQKLMWSGMAVITLVLNNKGQLMIDPQITVKGFGHDESIESEEDKNALRRVVTDAFEIMPKSQRLDDIAVQHAVKVAVRRALNELYGKKPVTDVHVMRV